ncbi:MAG TPA: hypothetical protein VHY83_08255 [Solirubrobacteraceae bacterium]|jgi:hypothetical protein|nr:hypothetical protein [Solirubrobacteraceae bacterium]
MADIGQLVDLLRAEARVAEAESEHAAAERLLELADDTGDMSALTERWILQANDDELRGFVAALRLTASGA